MEKKIRLVTCPRCGTRREWSEQNSFRPFCSERCKLIDLGAWATGEYRIPDSGPGPSGNPPPEG
jgi:uncharacterized protein